MNKLSGYIEAEIGGEIRPLKFGMGAWEIFVEITGIQLVDVGELAQSNPMKFSASIIYAGLKQAALAQDKSFDYNPRVIYDWIDELDQSIYNEIMQAVGKSKVIGKTMVEHLQGSDTTPSKKK